MEIIYLIGVRFKRWNHEKLSHESFKYSIQKLRLHTFEFVKYNFVRTHPQKLQPLLLFWKIGVFWDFLNFSILQANYSPDSLLIEYTHLPHETLAQVPPFREKWAKSKARNEIGQISSETKNVAILLLATISRWKNAAFTFIEYR